MNGLFLSSDELNELTGFKSAIGQCRWLDRNRWTYAVTRSGKPRVLREHFERRMGAGLADRGAAVHQTPNLEQPNFAAIARRK